MGDRFLAVLVHGDQRKTKEIGDVVAATTFTRLIQYVRGNEAITQLAHTDASLCIIASSLPDMKGTAALRRIREYRPNLPVIMLSDSRDEDVAIEAFHLNVLDYIPVRKGYLDVLADVVRSVYTGQNVAHTAMVEVPRGVPTELMTPTYQNRLRAIGRELDVQGYSDVVICEGETGFVVRALVAEYAAPVLLEFAQNSFIPLLADSISVRGGRDKERKTSILRGCYEHVLRALGYELDEIKARWITITEADAMLVVSGLVPGETTGQLTLERFAFTMNEEAIDGMLGRAIERRARRKFGLLG